MRQKIIDTSSQKYRIFILPLPFLLVQSYFDFKFAWKISFESMFRSFLGSYQLSTTSLNFLIFIFQIDCDGVFIGFSFKLLILLFGSWALFFRPTKATMPRIYLFRACICTLLFIFIFAFWLFYGVRVFDEQRRRIQYQDLVSTLRSNLLNIWDFGTNA